MPAFVERKGRDGMAAPTRRMGRFETEWQATDDHLAALPPYPAFGWTGHTTAERGR